MVGIPREEGIKDDLCLPDRKQLYLESLSARVRALTSPVSPDRVDSEIKALNAIVKELNRHYCDIMGFQRQGAFKIKVASEIRMLELGDSETIRTLIGRVAYLLGQ